MKKVMVVVGCLLYLCLCFILNCVHRPIYPSLSDCVHRKIHRVMHLIFEGGVGLGFILSLSPTPSELYSQISICVTFGDGGGGWGNLLHLHIFSSI